MHVAARMQVRLGWRLPPDSLGLPLTPYAGGVHQASGYSVSEHWAMGLPASLQQRGKARSCLLPPLVVNI